MKISIKPFIIAVLLAFTLSSHLLAKEKSDREQTGLVGPVRSVHTESTEITFQSGQQLKDEKKPLSMEVFDKRGNLIERILHYADKMPTNHMKWSYFYDNEGNILEKRSYNNLDVLISKDISTYDVNGKRKGKTAYLYDIPETVAGLSKLTEEYFYDLKGNLERIDLFANDHPSPLNKHIYTYDAHGNKTSKTSYCPNCDTPLVGKGVMRYDEKGRMIEFESYVSDGVFSLKEKISYDERGNPISIKDYGPDGILQNERNTVYEYDAKGNWIKSSSQETVFFRNMNIEVKKVTVVYRTIIYYLDDQRSN